MIPSTPGGMAASISLAVKMALLALVSLDLIPLTDDQVGTVALAASAVADVLIYFGILKPKPEAPAEETSADADEGEYVPEHAAPDAAPPA